MGPGANDLAVFGLVGTETIKDAIQKLMDDCSLSYKPLANRVCKLDPKKQDRIRPVKLHVEPDKWGILLGINSHNPLGIFMRLDLIKKEQEQDFLLRRELNGVRRKNPEKH